MKNIRIIEKNKQRVLTSFDLAEAFETDLNRIKYNFNYNKKRYEEGKHYFVLTGDELRDFKTEYEIHTSLKKVNTLYLWTEKGAFLHAKSLNTDKAWSAYTELVDDYFKKTEQIKSIQTDLSALSPQLQFMIMMEQRANELESKQNELNKAFRHLALVVDNEVWINDHQKADIKQAVKSRVGHLKSQAIDAHFQGAFSDLNKFFNVPKYDKIRRVDYEQAMDFIKGWYPKRKESTN